MFQRVVVPCVVVVGLSGCGGGSSSSSAAESSAVRASGVAAVARAAASSSSSSSGVSKPVSASTPAVVPLVDAKGNPIVPAAARAHTDAGAIAFTKYYGALLDYLDEHPNPRVAHAVAAADCSACDEIESLLRGEQRKGIHFIGSHTVLTKFATQFSPDHSQVIVSFRQTKVPCTRIDGPGKSVRLQAAKFDTRLLLLWGKSGWKIGNMGSDPA